MFCTLRIKAPILQVEVDTCVIGPDYAHTYTYPYTHTHTHIRTHTHTHTQVKVDTCVIGPNGWDCESSSGYGVCIFREVCCLAGGCAVREDYCLVGRVQGCLVGQVKDFFVHRV